METTALAMFDKTIKYESENIWIKLVCDAFNLNVQFQQRKIKNDPILSKLWTKNTGELSKNENHQSKMSTDLGIVDANGRVLLSKKGFQRWIQIINPNSIDENLRPSFLIYQELIFDYLMGSAEEQKRISTLNSNLQTLKMEYSRIGNEIRTTQKDLFEALNSRYQYRLPFNEQKQIN